MKVKIVKAFLGVYLSVCTVYGGIRAAYLTVTAAPAPAPDAASATLEDTAFGYSRIPEEPADSLSSISASSAAPAPSPTPEVASPPSEEPAEPDTAPDSAEEATPEPLLEEPEATPSAEALTEPPEESDDDDDYEASAPAVPVPSLEEYLSKLRCGGCGRNCLLSSPRCMNGRRKAQAAETEYAAEYGAQ